MIRETREMLAALAHLNQLVPEVVLRMMDGSLPPAKQTEFGDLMIATGELLQLHAHTAMPEIIESGDLTAGTQPDDVSPDEYTRRGYSVVPP